MAVVRLTKDEEQLLVDDETQRELYELKLDEGWTPSGGAEADADAADEAEAEAEADAEDDAADEAAPARSSRRRHR